MGKKVSVFVQNLLCGGTITLIAHPDPSLPLMANSLLTSLVLMRANASLMRSFRWSTYYIIFSTNTSWLSNAPTSKNQVGWGLETSEATPRNHGDQSIDLETADLSNDARTYNTVCMETWITV